MDNKLEVIVEFIEGWGIVSFENFCLSPVSPNLCRMIHRESGDNLCGFLKRENGGFDLEIYSTGGYIQNLIEDVGLKTFTAATALYDRNAKRCG